MLRPQVDLSARTPDGTVSLKGQLSVLPIEPAFRRGGRVNHADFPRLLRLFGIDYRPAGHLGEFVASAAVKADARQIAVSGLNGKLGDTTVAGVINVDRSGPRPRLTGDVKVGRLVLDPFLPAQRSASLPPAIIPAAWTPGRMPAARTPRLWRTAATAGRWSAAPMDLAALRAFDGDLKLAGEAVVYDGITVHDVAADATLAEGVLRIPSLTGTLFGGALKGDATVTSASKPALDASLSLTVATSASPSRRWRAGARRPATLRSPRPSPRPGAASPS